MAELIIEVIAATKEDKIIHLELLINGRRLKRSVTAEKVNTPAKLAAWVLRQPDLKETVEENLRRKLVVDYHTEQIQTEGGVATIPVIDEVTISHLPDEQAILDIEALPGWATFTGQQAEDFIEANVTSLATAKTVLKAMARLIIAEREIIKKLVERAKI